MELRVEGGPSGLAIGLWLGLAVVGFASPSALAQPVVVASGSWGSAPGEFGRVRGDVAAYDEFPDSYVASADGVVAVADFLNGRVKVFDGSGAPMGVIAAPTAEAPPGERWPEALALLPGNVVATSHGGTLRTWSAGGTSIASAAGFQGALAGVTEAGELVIETPESPPTWLIISSELSLVETKSQKPQDLVVEWERGVETEEGTPPRNVIRIKLGSESVTVNDVAGAIEQVARDASRRIYVVSRVPSGTSFDLVFTDGGTTTVEIVRSQVTRFDSSGAETGSLVLPADEYAASFVVDPRHDAAERPSVSYGHATIAPDGSILIARRSESGFAILRFGIDAPTVP